MTLPATYRGCWQSRRWRRIRHNAYMRGWRRGERTRLRGDPLLRERRSRDLRNAQERRRREAGRAGRCFYCKHAAHGTIARNLFAGQRIVSMAVPYCGSC